MSLLTELSGVLAPLVVANRPTIDCVRFVGSETDLCAFATNGHVLVTITVLGDFSHMGDALLPGDIARAIGVRDWAANPWDDPEQDRDLTVERHLRPAREHFLTLEEVSRVMPRSRAPAKSVGFFLGPALRTMSSVVARLGLGVQLSGSGDNDWMAALRADSRPFLMKNGSVAWLSAAVMPSNEAKP